MLNSITTKHLRERKNEKSIKKINKKTIQVCYKYDNNETIKQQFMYKYNCINNYEPTSSTYTISWFVFIFVLVEKMIRMRIIVPRASC